MFKYIFSKTGVYLIILVFIVPTVTLLLLGNASKKKINKNNGQLQTPIPSATITQINMDELRIEDIVVGIGDEAVSGKKVTVNYLGTLTDGTKFDSSYDRGILFAFNLGAGEVIKGWDLGVVSMKVGGKRRLTIPPALGYGEKSTDPLIPPNSTLIFEIELEKVE